MLPDFIPSYSVGPFFGLASNVVMALLCLVNFLLHRHYRPVWRLFLFYALLTLFFLGWVIYGLQRSPQSILTGYRVSQAALAMLPASWIWFMLSLLNEKPTRFSWTMMGISMLLAGLALGGKGAWFFGVPLEIHPSEAGILRPRSLFLRPFINLFCLFVCLFYVLVTAIKLKQLKDQKPAYLLPFGIGLLFWFLGGTHDALLSFGIIIFTKEKVLWFASFWLSIFLAVAIAIHYRSLEQAVREARDVFEKFVPAAYLRRIAAKGLRSIRLGEADQQEVTILCCDIRGFTPLSERLSPSQLIAFINRLLERLTKVVTDHGGVIDKFLGDAILCIFEGTDSAQRGVDCGVGLLNSVHLFNDEEVKRGGQSVQIGIGIHTGQVILGTIGSSQRMDSTVLGATVNMAKRLEEITKRIGVDMLISDKVFDRLPRGDPHRLRGLGEVWVRGSLTPLTIFEVYDHNPPEVRERKDRGEAIMAEAIEFLRSGHLENALSRLEQVLHLLPQDPPVRLLVASLSNALQQGQPIQGGALLDLR